MTGELEAYLREAEKLSNTDALMEEYALAIIEEPFNMSRFEKILRKIKESRHSVVINVVNRRKNG